MNHYLIVCRSVTQAQRVGLLFSAAGITNQVHRSPVGLTERGCSYSVRVPERYIRPAVERLRAAGPAYYKIFRGSGGDYSEVFFP